MKMMKASSRGYKEIRQGILDARRGSERPWSSPMDKQGLYWDAHQRTVRKIVRRMAPMYLQEKKLALELELLDDGICDLYSGQWRLLEGVPAESREHIREYLDTWLTDFRDIRDHYGLTHK